jgi:NADPH:quinone reductase
MRALQVTRLEGPDGLELVDVPEPEGGDAVRIDVVAAGASFPDLLLSRGQYQIKPDPPFVPGVEVAGVVRDAPEGSGVQAGDHVMAFTFGGFAETVLAPAAMTFPVPEGLGFDAAAGFIMNHHTAHFALHRRGRLAEGETVLVHGAAGGVGTAVVQVAKGAGARVIATASTPEKAEVARQAGADEAVLADEGWVQAVRELTGGRGADVIADPVGGDRFDASLRCLAPEGRLLVIGFTSGRIPEVAVNRLLLRNVDVVGVAWGAFLGVDPDLGRAIAEDLDRLVAAGHVRPVVGATYPLEEGAQALRDLEDRAAQGKIVLRVREDPA